MVKLKGVKKKTTQVKNEKMKTPNLFKFKSKMILVFSNSSLKNYLRGAQIKKKPRKRGKRNTKKKGKKKKKKKKKNSFQN